MKNDTILHCVAKKPDTRIMVNNFQQTSGTINAIWPNCLPLL